MFRVVRRFLGLKPPYFSTRQKLYAAIESRRLSESMLIEAAMPEIERIVGWDSRFDGPDSLELQMEAEKLGVDVRTVADFLRMLETVDKEFE